jgi:hypothetical protein
MRKRVRAELTSFTAIQSYLDQHAERFAAVNATGARTALDDAVLAMKSAATGREVQQMVSRGARAKHLSSRSALLQHHMRAVSVAARAGASKVPALAALTMPRDRVGTPALLDAAKAMIEVASQYQAELSDLLGPDFLDKLVAVTEDVRDATHVGKESRLKRKAGTATLKDSLAKARDAVRILDVLVRRNVVDDAALTEEWVTRRRVAGVPRPAPESEETAAVPSLVVNGGGDEVKAAA